jgi:hypothetical protein
MRASIIVAAFSVCVGGCLILPPYDSVDIGKTSDGKPFLRDTPRTWSELKAHLDRHMEDEKRALRPQGGFPDWNSFWSNSIKVWREGGVEHPQKYVDYIVQRRRELGLPDLVLASGGVSDTR